MAFKLTAKEDRRFNELVENMTEMEEQLHQQLQAYNEAVQEVEIFKDTIVDRWKTEYDNKSDSWRDSDKGQEVEALIAEWDALNVDEVKLEDLSLRVEMSELHTDIDV